MSPERGQAGTEAAEAGNGAGRWEAAARHRARLRHCLPPLPRRHPAAARAAPGRCGRWGTGSGNGPGRAKRSLGNYFASSAGGLEKIGEV